MKTRNLVAHAVMATLFFANVGYSALTNGNFDAQDTSMGDVGGAPTGWSSFGDPGTIFVSSQATPAQSAPNVLKMFGFDNGGVGVFQTFPAAPGQTWVGNGFGQNWALDRIQGTDTGRLQIQFLDALGGPAPGAGGTFANGFNQFDSNIIDANTPVDVWLPLGVGTAPAPLGTAQVRINVLKLNSNVGGSTFFDTISLSSVAVPEPGSFALLSFGALGVVARRRRRR